MSEDNDELKAILDRHRRIFRIAHNHADWDATANDLRALIAAREKAAAKRQHEADAESWSRMVKIRMAEEVKAMQGDLAMALSELIVESGRSGENEAVQKVVRIMNAREKAARIAALEECASLATQNHDFPVLEVERAIRELIEKERAT